MRLLVTVIVALACVSAGPEVLAQAEDAQATYERRVRQQKIGTRHIPADLNDAMATLDALTSEASKEQYVSRDEDEAVERLFFSFGRWIAINWGLYDGSRFSAYLRGFGVDQPDGQKEFIMRAYHRHLRGVDLDVPQLAGAYKAAKAARDSARRAEATVLDSYTRPAPDSLRNR